MKWKKIFANCISDKRLIPKIYIRDTYDSIAKTNKQTIQIKNRGNWETGIDIYALICIK